MPLLSLPPRRARALVAAAAAALALTGCSASGTTAPAPASPASTGAGSPAGTSAASPGTSETGAPGATESGSAGPVWPTPLEISAEGIEAMDLYTVSDNTRGTHLVVPQVPGADPLNEHLRQEATGRAEAFWKSVEATASSGAAPALNGRWGLVGASRDVLGVLTSVSESSGATTASGGHTHWFDAHSGSVIAPEDLIEANHLPEFERAVRRAVADLPGAVRDVVPSTEDLAWEAVQGQHVRTWFSPGGDLLVGFDEHAVLAGGTGAPAIAIPEETVTPWLSSEGRAVKDAVLHPDIEAWNAAHQPQAQASASAAATTVPGVPAPTATPSATATAPAAGTSKAADGDTDCSVAKCVALTFDDGPKPATDGPLLKILADHQVKATFFLLGTNVEAFPDTARKIAAAGHELGNHSQTHSLLNRLSAEDLDAELEQANTAVKEATGRKPTLMRPPYGATNPAVKKAIAAHGMHEQLWNLDTLDWSHRNPAKTLAAVKKDARPGSVILMHDIHATSVAAVDDVITWLEGQGYTLVTVSDLNDG